MAPKKLTADAERLLHWLENDDDDDIFIPAAPSKQSADNKHDALEAKPNSCPIAVQTSGIASPKRSSVKEVDDDSDAQTETSGAPTPVPISFTPQSVDSSSHVPCVEDTQTANNDEGSQQMSSAEIEVMIMTQIEHLAIFSSLILTETEGRHELFEEAMREWTANYHVFHRTLIAMLIDEANKAKTIMNNRELISSDLVKEMYECGKSQRAEMQQMLVLFQQVAGAGLLGGTPTGHAAHAADKRRR